MIRKIGGGVDHSEELYDAPSAATCLRGLVVVLALNPEAIASSIIAGVDPKIGLYASFSTDVVIAFAGGAPG